MTKPEPNAEEAMLEIVRLHEREKSLIGYDLHDGIAQLIVGAKMNLESISLERLPEKDVKKISDAQQYLSDAISDLRHLIGDLRASSIDPRAVALELESLIDRYHSAERTVSFYADEAIHELPSMICGAVYRIIQEALNNIKKHSQATEVKIILQCRDSRWQLCIADNGIGLSTTHPNAGPQIQSFGLSGILFRAKATGGKVCFYSKLANESPHLDQALSSEQDTDKLLLDGTGDDELLYPMDKWLTDVANTKTLELSGGDFCYGTLIDVQWPVSF